jgi:glucokinase
MSTKDHPLAIGIDMGGTSVKYGVVRGAEILHTGDPIITSDFKGPKLLVAEITRRVHQLRSLYPGIEALGIGVPGFVDVQRGVVHELTNVPGWKEVPVRNMLTESTGLPSFAENDANAMCFAEFVHGAGIGARNMIAITLGTGVGGGLVLDGRLYRGSSFGAGEVGQMSIDWQGKEFVHGNVGALESYTGIGPLGKRAAALYRKAKIKKTAAECEPRALAAAVKQKDPVAMQVWDEFTSQLSTGLVNAVWLLNPDRIVIGGGIAKAGKLIFDPLWKKMKAQLADSFIKGLKVVPAHFGNDAGIIGTAAVAMEAARA